MIQPQSKELRMNTVEEFYHAIVNTIAIVMRTRMLIIFALILILNTSMLYTEYGNYNTFMAHHTISTEHLYDISIGNNCEVLVNSAHTIIDTTNKTCSDAMMPADINTILDMHHRYFDWSMFGITMFFTTIAYILFFCTYYFFNDVEALFHFKRILFKSFVYFGIFFMFTLYPLFFMCKAPGSDFVTPIKGSSFDFSWDTRVTDMRLVDNSRLMMLADGCWLCDVKQIGETHEFDLHKFRREQD